MTAKIERIRNMKRGIPGRISKQITRMKRNRKAIKGAAAMNRLLKLKRKSAAHRILTLVLVVVVTAVGVLPGMGTAKLHQKF